MQSLETPADLHHIESLFAARKYRQAAEAARQLIAAEPDNAPAHELLGLCALHFKDYVHAQAEAGRALELDPAAYRSRLVLARVHIVKGRFAEAEAEARAARDAEPERWEGNSVVGELLWRQGRKAEALPFAQKAAQLAPGERIARNNYAVMLYLIGRHAEAMSEARAAFGVQGSLMGALLIVRTYLGAHTLLQNALWGALAIIAYVSMRDLPFRALQAIDLAMTAVCAVVGTLALRGGNRWGGWLLIALAVWLGVLGLIGFRL